MTRRALIVGGAAVVAAAVGCRTAASGGPTSKATAIITKASTPDDEASTTTEDRPADEPDRVLTDGEDFPDGFVVPAGEVWALAPGAQVTTARNVVVEGTLRLHQSDPSATMRLTFVDVDESAFVGGDTHEVVDNDIGLWMINAGRLDVKGAPKTSWSRLTGDATQGANEIEVEDASGWRAGDEVAVTATVSRSVDRFHQQSDRAVVTSVNGNRVRLEEALQHDHPMVDGRWPAEVINLTRSVVIEGTPDHKAHIIYLHQGMHAPRHFRNSSIEHLEVRHMGPNTANNGGEVSSVLTRYALHWHHGRQTTDGVVVTGVVVHDCGAHAFVPHASNGMTFRDCASYSTVGDAYWWDPSDVSDFVVYDRCIASEVLTDGASPYKTNGFFAAESDEARSCVMRNCVAAGVSGPDSGGYFWDNGSHGVWVFEDCVAHNVESNGIRVWQNTSTVHDIERFTTYNCHTGISHGAYGNPYQYHGMTVHNCEIGLSVTAVTNANDDSAMEFHDVVVTGCDTPLMLADAPIDASRPTDFRQCQFDHVVVDASHDGQVKQWDFVNCGLTRDDFEVRQLVGDVRLRLQEGGQAWQLTNGNQWSEIATF